MTLHNLWERFEAQTLRVRLIGSLGFGAFVTLLIGSSALFGIRWFAAETNRIFEGSTQTVIHAEVAHVQLVKIRRSVGNLLIATTDSLRSETRADLAIAREKLDRELGAVRSKLDSPERKKQFDKVEQQVRDYLYNIERAVALIDRGSPTAIDFVLGPEVHGTKIRTEAALDELIHDLVDDSESAMQRSQQTVATTEWEVAAASIIGLGLGLILAIVLIRSVENPAQRLVKSVEAMIQGQHDAPVPFVDLKNETGQMARALEQLRLSVKSAADETWIKDSSASVLAAIRGASSGDELAKALLSALAPLLSLGHGVFYRTDPAGNLALLGTYAMTQRKRLQTTFQPGEGLPGQCLREREPIHITLPSDHVTITSGLGEAPACQVLAWPFMLGDSVVAVMELAAFSQFTPRQHRLLQVLSNPIASTLQVLDRNQRTQELLELAQTQSEQMQKQAAKLEEQAVEMEAQQAELREADTWYRNVINSLADGLIIVDASGDVVMSNPAAERLFGGSEGSLAGRSIESILSADGRFAVDAAFEDGEQATAVTHTFRARRADGSHFQSRASITTLPARSGHQRTVSVTVHSLGE